MANPQIENGYTRIANELLEAICQLNISGREMRILLFILRRTYGYNCKSAQISLSEISAAVGIRNEHVSKILKRLSNDNIISVQSNKGVRPQTISIVKNYDKWNTDICTSLLLPKLATVAENGNTTIAENGNTTIAENGNTTIAKFGNHTYKENIKENIIERKKEPAAAHVGENNRAFVNDDNYNKLKKEYGSATVDKYISRVDKWAFKNNKNVGECSDYIWKWLEQDNVQKVDPEINEYEKVVNQFLPL